MKGTTRNIQGSLPPLDTYPDKWNNRRDGATGEAASYSNGQTPYTRNAANRCVQTFAAKTIFDLNVTYAFTDSFGVTLGVNNLLDTYPDKWNNRRDGATGEAASYSNGQTPYTRNANQFGFNGSYYYLSANVKF